MEAPKNASDCKEEALRGEWLSATSRKRKIKGHVVASAIKDRGLTSSYQIQKDSYQRY